MIKVLKVDTNFGFRLDKYLKNTYSSLTQSFIQKNIRKKNIKVNNFKTTANYILKQNDEITILNFHKDLYKNRIVFKKNILIPNEFFNKFKKSTLFENNDFIILNKWSNISTQGGHKINISIDDIIKKISLNYKLVHRLDKDTAGLLIIAKNLETAKIFGNLFKSHLIEKTYLALCEGRPNIIESNLKLDIKGKQNKLNPTETYYKVLQNSNSISLILFQPKTGKNHQLRIVSKNLGSPIIGDKKYNYQSKFKNEILKLNAFNLNFEFRKKKFSFTSFLPNDFVLFTKINNISIPEKILN